MSQPRAVVSLVTAPVGEARAIATALVEREQAACVNVVPLVHSVYRWEGEVESDEEALLIVKTTEAAVPGLTDALEQLHPYENFELVRLAIDGGSRRYLDWLVESAPGGAGG
jgi:periplasmic divalent cation tolerance protein